MTFDKETMTEIYQTQLNRLADLKEYVGREMGITDWMTITQDRINAFADATDDHQWIHVDTERARHHSPFARTIAHGFLILALTPRVCYETFSIDDVHIGVNYGLDRVRFIRPVPEGSLIRGRVKLMSVQDFPGGAKFKLKITYEIKDDERPVCMVELISQCYREE